jgi:hypothetical protein
MGYSRNFVLFFRARIFIILLVYKPNELTPLTYIIFLRIYFHIDFPFMPKSLKMVFHFRYTTKLLYEFFIPLVRAAYSKRLICIL